MFRRIAGAILILMLAFSAAPVSAFSMPDGAGMMPMNGSQGDRQVPGCDCNQPMQQAASARAESGPRPASQQGTSPCTGFAQQLVATPDSSGRVRGIRRIYAKNVLDHTERAAVYALIVATPGVDLSGISAGLDMNRQTLRYHLELMESFSKIVVVRDHGATRYYENHGRFSAIERNVLLHLWNPTAGRILSLITEVPGITQSGIAGRLAITAPTVRWYMQRFEEDGIIIARHEGRYTRYALTNEASRYVVIAAGKSAPIAIAA
jgi:predicted transcriptional regulator